MALDLASLNPSKFQFFAANCESRASGRAAIDQTAALGDAGTSDLLTGMVRELDKDIWFLDAHRA